MDAQAPSDRESGLRVVIPAAERLLDAALAAGIGPVCRWGHGPLTGWRARPGGRRGRYCLKCNVEANRRWRARHARAR
jgi:hypothetical protein